MDSTECKDGKGGEGLKNAEHYLWKDPFVNSSSKARGEMEGL